MIQIKHGASWANSGWEVPGEALARAATSPWSFTERLSQPAIAPMGLDHHPVSRKHCTWRHAGCFPRNRGLSTMVATRTCMHNTLTSTSTHESDILKYNVVWQIRLKYMVSFKQKGWQLIATEENKTSICSRMLRWLLHVMLQLIKWVAAMSDLKDCYGEKQGYVNKDGQKDQYTYVPFPPSLYDYLHLSTTISTNYVKLVWMCLCGSYCITKGLCFWI